MKKILLLALALNAWAIPNGYYACEADFSGSKPTMLKIVNNSYKGQKIEVVKDGIYLFTVGQFRCFEEDKD